MKIEALNCPNCGAGALSDSTRCDFCESRLKTSACPSCFGLMFIGSQNCSHCGKKTVRTETIANKKSGDCPRCKIKLNSLQIQEISLLECQKCGGFWSDTETFENICAEKESQSHVLFFVQNKQFSKLNVPINYIPCPDCKVLMNRNNFAHSSGIILDICKLHGVWFDAEELPKIIEFIRHGGLDHARQKEKIYLEEQRRNLIDKQRQIAHENARYNPSYANWSEDELPAIRRFIKMLFD